MRKVAAVTAVFLSLFGIAYLFAQPSATDDAGLDGTARQFMQQAEMQMRYPLCGKVDAGEMLEAKLQIAVRLAQTALGEARKAREVAETRAGAYQRLANLPAAREMQKEKLAVEARIPDFEHASAQLSGKLRKQSAALAPAREQRREAERVAREAERAAKDQEAKHLDAIYRARTKEEQASALLANQKFQIGEMHRTGDGQRLPGIKAEFERLRVLYPWLEEDLRKLEAELKENKTVAAAAGSRSCRG